jgi:hypothetical protein
MKFSLYSKKNRLDEMQEQTMRKIESHGFWLLWGSLLAAWIVQMMFGAADKAAGEWVVFMIGCIYGCRVSAQWSVGSPPFGYGPGQCRVVSGGCGGGYADLRVFPWILGRCCFCRCFYRHPVLCIAAAVRRIDTQTARASG